MAAHIYSERQIESIVRSTKQFRLRYCLAAGGILLAAVVVASLQPAWIFGTAGHGRTWVAAALFVFFAGPLADSVWRWRSRPENLELSLRAIKIEVTREGVTRSGPSPLVRQLAWSEIQRAEEVPWGIYLRGPTRYRWILIPRKIEGFEEIVHELEDRGIAMVQAAVPPNWEEFAGVLVFTATMICAIFAHSARVLAIDCFVSVLVAAVGFLVVSANPDNLPKMRWARFGVFLPVAMTLSMLWLAVRR
jgi:preprotein translocase subunit Sss1